MSRLRFTLIALVFVPVAAFAIDPTVATPPVAKKAPHKIEWHGDSRIDNYFWIKDKKDPEVLKYLDAENAYTKAVLKPTESFQAKLYTEFLSRIKQTDQDVPVRDRGYWYYARTVEGQQYPIHCRKKAEPVPKAPGEARKTGTLSAPEEVLLDGNAMAKGEKFFSFGSRRVSDDVNLLAFATDTTGFREYELSVKDLRTGKVIESKFVKAPQFEWAADNKTLLPSPRTRRARSQAVAACHRAAKGERHAPLRGEGRNLLAGPVDVARPEVPVPHVGQFHQHRATVPRFRHTCGRVEDDPGS